MSDLITSFLTLDLEVTRYEPGRYVKGRYREGASRTFMTKASIQPSTPREITMFPEGRRGGEIKVVYTCDELRIPDEGPNQTKGDTFVYKGNVYEVHKVEDWSDNTDLPHYKSFAFLIDDTRGADVK